MSFWVAWWWVLYSELILGLRPANERRHYFVTMSLIGCVLFMDMYGLIVSQVASVLSSNE